MRGELTQDSTHQRQNSLHFLFFFAPFQGHLELTPLWFIPFRPNHAPDWVFLYLTLSCCPAHKSCRALPLLFNQHQGQPHHLYLKLKRGGEKGPRRWRKYSDHAEKLSLWGGRNAKLWEQNSAGVISGYVHGTRVCCCGTELTGQGPGLLWKSCRYLCKIYTTTKVFLSSSSAESSENSTGLFRPWHCRRTCTSLPHTHLSRYTHPLLSARVKNQTGSWPLRWEHFDTEIK